MLQTVNLVISLRDYSGTNAYAERITFAPWWQPNKGPVCGNAFRLC